MLNSSVFISTIFCLSCLQFGKDETVPLPRKEPYAFQWEAIADSCSAALNMHFWNNSKYYNNASPSDGNFNYWPQAHALDVLVDAYIRTANANYKAYMDDWFVGVPLNTLLYDLPSYATGNAGISDETVRELSVYAKGQIGKLDYRLVIADPYTNVSADPQYNLATFSKTHPNKDYSGYFKYEFFDSENNSSPFHSGTYNGKKKVLALGVGFD